MQVSKSVKIFILPLYNFSEVKYNADITKTSLRNEKGNYIMKKIIAMLLAIMLMLTCFTACGAKEATDMSTIKKAGRIVVGITDYAPMDYKDENGEWTGFDAEFARLFAEELKVECEFYELPNWGTKFMELETKQIDAVWNGMTITDEAKANSSVSDPYVINAQVVVTKIGALDVYGTVEDLAGLNIAVESGSAGESCANEIAGATVIPLQNQEAALMEVAAGTSDACVIDITMANAMTGEGTSYADLGYKLSLSEELYGVSFRKDSDLTAAFNEFMAKLKADGTLQELAAKYNLTLAD